MSFVDFAKKEAMNYALPSSSIYGRLGQALGQSAGLFQQGGVVRPPSAGPLASKLSMDQLKMAREAGAISQEEFLKALHKADGGFIGTPTPGPLSMKDMTMAGKDREISKIMYKKKGGEVEDTMEISYHNPYGGQSSSSKEG